jgi:hypothetical protein
MYSTTRIKKGGSPDAAIDNRRQCRSCLLERVDACNVNPSLSPFQQGCDRLELLTIRSHIDIGYRDPVPFGRRITRDGGQPPAWLHGLQRHTRLAGHSVHCCRDTLLSSELPGRAGPMGIMVVHGVRGAGIQHVFAPGGICRGNDSGAQRGRDGDDKAAGDAATPMHEHPFPGLHLQTLSDCLVCGQRGHG